MAAGIPSNIKKALEQGNLKIRQRKNAERVKEIDHRLEELTMKSKVNAGQGPDTGAEPAIKPLTAIALTVGRLFRPAKDESKMIDEQLSRVIAESASIAEKPKPADGLRMAWVAGADKAETDRGYREAVKNGISGDREIKETAYDMKAVTVNDHVSASCNGANGEQEKKLDEPFVKPNIDLPKAPPPPEAAVKPGTRSFSDELMSKLAETAIVKKDVTLDIMRDMKGQQIRCDELQDELQEISVVLKKAANKNQKKR